jgi:transcriptional regulator with XRE-family HTH domain
MKKKPAKRQKLKLEIIAGSTGDKTKDWGKRVKETRKNSGLTQKEFSKLLGISHSYLSGIERSVKKPGPAFFIRLAEKLGISLDYILLGVEPAKLEEKAGKKSPGREAPGGLNTIDDLIWLMEHSSLFNFNVMGFATRFYMENEDFIKKTIKKPGLPGESSPGTNKSNQNIPIKEENNNE